MELEVPPCSDSELAMLLDKWSRRAVSRDPLALAMARAFSRERQRRDALRQHVSRSCTGQPTRRCAEARAAPQALPE